MGIFDSLKSWGYDTATDSDTWTGAGTALLSGLLNYESADEQADARRNIYNDQKQQYEQEIQKRRNGWDKIGKVLAKRFEEDPDYVKGFVAGTQKIKDGKQKQKDFNTGG